MGISSFFAAQGYTCWILEWRNHGDSSPSALPFNFETIAQKDFSVAFRYLVEEKKIENLHCITHSGGGICLTIFLINHAQYRAKIKSITFFGCQAFGAANSVVNFAKIWLGKYMSALLGYVPGQKTGSAEDESYFMMKQWFNWNLTRQFVGDNQTNYQALMHQIQIPILSICGAGDRFIAPQSGCASFLKAFDNAANQLLFCAKENGYQEDYNHSRILHSSNAQKEIYPQVFKWMLAAS